MFSFAVFYLVAGIVNLAILGVYGFGLLHVALVAVLSLFAAYGLFRLQRWSMWLVVGLFFVATTYGGLTLMASTRNIGSGLDTSSLFSAVILSIYLALTWIATGYVVARRENLK